MKAPKVVVLTTLPANSSPTSTSFIIVRMRSTSASPSVAVGRVDEHLALVVDVDLRFELLGEPANRFAALADQHADLRRVDLDRLDTWGVLAELLARALDHLGHLAEDERPAPCEPGSSASRRISNVTPEILMSICRAVMP